jgi:hypothetical protein
MRHMMRYCLKIMAKEFFSSRFHEMLKINDRSEDKSSKNNKSLPKEKF